MIEPIISRIRDIIQKFICLTSRVTKYTYLTTFNKLFFTLPFFLLEDKGVDCVVSWTDYSNTNSNN